MELTSTHLGLDRSSDEHSVDKEALRKAFELMDTAAQYTVSDSRTSLRVGPEFIRTIYGALGMDIPEEVTAMLQNPETEITLPAANLLRGSGRGMQRIMSLEERARSMVGAVHRMALIPKKP